MDFRATSAIAKCLHPEGRGNTSEALSESISGVVMATRLATVRSPEPPTKPRDRPHRFRRR
jgi:hypothetical protein